MLFELRHILRQEVTGITFQWLVKKIFYNLVFRLLNLTMLLQLLNYFGRMNKKIGIEAIPVFFVL
jgi:hypothetical protein